MPRTSASILVSARFLFGVALLVVSAVVYHTLNPSPYGEPQMFFVMPIASLGLAACGAAFVAERPVRNHPMFWIGWGLIVLAVSPLLLLILFFWRSQGW